MDVSSESGSLKLSPLSNLLQIDIYFPITSRICDFLSILDIIRLSRTCRSLQNLYSFLIPHKWDIDRALKRFFDDPKALRAQLGVRDALIGGSFALQFFERVAWDDDGIEIFVEEGLEGDALVHYILDKEKYSFFDGATTATGDPDGLLSLSRVCFLTVSDDNA